MHLLLPLYLLNATNNSNVTRRDTSSVCIFRSDAYDSDECHRRALGGTQSELHRRAFDSTANTLVYAPNASEESNCPDRFYVFGFDEFEAQYPSLKSCKVTSYAAMVQATALEAPCRTRSKSDAKFLMIPPYLAAECNWPVYGEGCNGRTNVHRQGPHCGEEVLEIAREVRAGHPGKPLLLVEQTTAIDQYSFHPTPPEDPGLIFARITSVDPGNYRPGLDISMPPPATLRCGATPREAYDEPLSAKRYFLSFKGRLSDTNDIRQSIRAAFHNGDDVVIARSDETQYDYDTLLHHSRFNLVVRGDLEFSYRWVEAVCSGGVPVMVSYSWVPPFNEFAQFDTFGVFLKSASKFDPRNADRSLNKWEDLLGVLRNLTDAEVQEKRERAIVACKRYFATTKTQVQALMRGLLARPMAALDEAAGSGP